MKEKFLILIYLLAVAYLSSCSNIWSMLITLVFVAVISGRETARIFKKVILSTAILNLLVSIGYILAKKQGYITFIVIFNLRVFAITCLTLLFTSKINIFKALSFSKTLSTLLTITYSQIIIFRNTFNEFRLAFKSRAITKPDVNKIHNFIASTSYFFLNKALNSSTEIAQAMKSRGFFND